MCLMLLEVLSFIRKVVTKPRHAPHMANQTDCRIYEVPAQQNDSRVRPSGYCPLMWIEDTTRLAVTWPWVSILLTWQCGQLGAAETRTTNWAFESWIQVLRVVLGRRVSLGRRVTLGRRVILG